MARLKIILTRFNGISIIFFTFCFILLHVTCQKRPMSFCEVTSIFNYVASFGISIFVDHSLFLQNDTQSKIVLFYYYYKV